MQFPVPRPKKESIEAEGVLKHVMKKSRSYQNSLPKSTGLSRDVYKIDPNLEVIRVPADPKIYGKNQFLDYVQCTVETRRE